MIDTDLNVFISISIFMPQGMQDVCEDKLTKICID